MFWLFKEQQKQQQQFTRGLEEWGMSVEAAGDDPVEAAAVLVASEAVARLRKLRRPNDIRNQVFLRSITNQALLAAGVDITKERSKTYSVVRSVVNEAVTRELDCDNVLWAGYSDDMILRVYYVKGKTNG